MMEMIWVLSKSCAKEVIIQARKPVLGCAMGTSLVHQWERGKTRRSSAEPRTPGTLCLPSRTAATRLSKPSSQRALVAEPSLLAAAWSLFGCFLGLSFVYSRDAKICKDLATLVFFP